MVNGTSEKIFENKAHDNDPSEAPSHFIRNIIREDADTEIGITQINARSLHALALCLLSPEDEKKSAYVNSLTGAVNLGEQKGKEGKGKPLDKEDYGFRRPEGGIMIDEQPHEDDRTQV